MKKYLINYIFLWKIINLRIQKTDSVLWVKQFNTVVSLVEILENFEKNIAANYKNFT